MTTNSNSKKGIILAVFVVLVVFGFRGYRVYKSWQEVDKADVFGVTTLNTNLVSNFSEKTDNLEANTLQGTLSEHKDPDGKPYRLSALEVINPDGKTMRPANSYVEYVQKTVLGDIDTQIAKVKELKSTQETKPIIDASLNYFTEAKKIYATELVKVAKMYDDKVEKPEITAFAKQTSEKVQPILNAEREILLAIALPFAKKNGVEVNINSFSDGIKVLSVPAK